MTGEQREEQRENISRLYWLAHEYAQEGDEEGETIANAWAEEDTASTPPPSD